MYFDLLFLVCFMKGRERGGRREEEGVVDRRGKERRGKERGGVCMYVCVCVCEVEWSRFYCLVFK